MRVLLISANTERLNLPALPLGLALVGAAAREAGHDVAFLNLMLESGAVAAVIAPGLERELPHLPGGPGAPS